MSNSEELGSAGSASGHAFGRGSNSFIDAWAMPRHLTNPAAQFYHALIRHADVLKEINQCDLVQNLQQVAKSDLLDARKRAIIRHYFAEWARLAGSRKSEQARCYNVSSKFLFLDPQGHVWEAEKAERLFANYALHKEQFVIRIALAPHDLDWEVQESGVFGVLEAIAVPIGENLGSSEGVVAAADALASIMNELDALEDSDARYGRLRDALPQYLDQHGTDALFEVQNAVLGQTFEEPARGILLEAISHVHFSRSESGRYIDWIISRSLTDPSHFVRWAAISAALARKIDPAILRTAASSEPIQRLRARMERVAAKLEAQRVGSSDSQNR